MKVKMTTTEKEINQVIKDAEKYVEDRLIMMLSYLGEMCVIEAKNRSAKESWNDQTGNLRSSIGYVIAKDGKVSKITGFSTILQGTQGVSTGRAFAMERAKNHPKGFALIVVAGMKYAERVEAMDNKVVLASAELLARRKLPSMIKQLFG